MSPRRINPEILRAALRNAERRLAEILTDLESNDMDDQAVADRLREITRGLAPLARAA